MGLIWGETLTWPPSGNNLLSTKRRGHCRYPSKAYKEWDAINLAAIQAMPTMPMIDYQVRLQLVFRPPDRRPYDLDNRTKAVQDLLRKARVIKDDDVRYLNPVNLSGVPSVKGEPGFVLASLYTL